MRREKADDKRKTLGIFKKEHESEVERKIKQLKKEADFIIDNNSDREALFQQIDQTMDMISKKKGNLV